MNLFERWKAPTPAFFKKLIRVSLSAAAGAGAGLMIEPIGSAMIPGFTFHLIPWVAVAFKNIVAVGIVSAAISKTMVDKDALNDKP